MWHLYPIRVPHEMRRPLFEYLRANGVIVQVNYIPAYWHPVYEDLGYKNIGKVYNDMVFSHESIHNTPI